MTNRHKCLLSTFALSLCLLVSCAAQTAVQEPVTLRVLTEKSTSDGMNYQAEEIAKQFMETHDGVTVQLEFLPIEKEERTLFLYQMRSEIMAGGGPDVYLLPSGDSLFLDYSTPALFTSGLTKTLTVEPLFPDVRLAMINGIFQDINTYYINDSSLQKQALNHAVMEAGVLDGQRYVLPLRYNLPVLMQSSDDTRVDVTEQTSILDLAELAVSTGDTALALVLEMPDDFSCFPALLDHRRGAVLVSQSDLSRYLTLYQQICALRTEQYHVLETQIYDRIYGSSQTINKPSLDEWLRTELRGPLSFQCDASSFSAFYFYWKTQGFPIYIGDIGCALHNAAIDHFLGQASDLQPLCAEGGTVAAEVTYFGAVGASCDTPALAYEFLREFLTEEAQWDGLRPRTDYSQINDTFRSPPQLQRRGLIENSWPVRFIGAVPNLWETLQLQIYSGYPYIGYGIDSFNTIYDRDVTLQRAQRFLLNITLTDEDLPVLFSPIDEVRFPVTLPEDESMAWALAQLNEEDGTPTDVDIDALAEQLHQNLWWHLAEG